MKTKTVNIDLRLLSLRQRLYAAWLLVTNGQFRILEGGGMEITLK